MDIFTLYLIGGIATVMFGIWSFSNPTAEESQDVRDKPFVWLITFFVVALIWPFVWVETIRRA